MLDKTKLIKQQPVGRIFSQGRTYLLLSKYGSGEQKWQHDGDRFFVIPEQGRDGKDATALYNLEGEPVIIYPWSRDLTIVGHFLIEWGSNHGTVYCLPYPTFEIMETWEEGENDY